MKLGTATYFSGAIFGAAPGAANPFLATIVAGAAVGAMSSAIYGGNILQGAIIGAAGAAIGYGFAQWGGPKGLDLHKFGQGVLATMSGGTVGGLSSAAMGGDFWQGFTQGAVAAGLSYAANVVADQLVVAQKNTSQSGLPSKRRQIEGTPDLPPGVLDTAKENLDYTKSTVETRGTESRFKERVEAAIKLKDGALVQTVGVEKEGPIDWSSRNLASAPVGDLELYVSRAVPNPSDIDTIYVIHSHGGEGNVITWGNDVSQMKQWVNGLNKLYQNAGYPPHAVQLSQVAVLVPNWQGYVTLANPATGRYYYWHPSGW